MQSTARLFLLLVILALVPATASAQDGLRPGSPLPSARLELEDARGGRTSLADLAGAAGTVVLFWSDECPWVTRYEQRVLELAKSFAGQDISFVLINSGASSARTVGDLPVLIDPQSQVAVSFGAQRAPHVFLFDEDRTLAYMGGIDDSPGDATNVKQEYLRDAIDALLVGSTAPTQETKAFGCVLRAK